MSFKREGDDTALLGNLRRRRIKDLLEEDVPEDEAKLLCNGRFSCLVCPQRPIFDTVSMLTLHRKGKKHAACESIFIQKKKELKHLILKRQHEQFMRDGTVTVKQTTSSTSGGISTSEPYDPRVRKHKVKPYERKHRLELDETQVKSVQRSAAQQMSLSDVPVRHSHQLKNVFRSYQPQDDHLPFQPYQSKRRQFSRVSDSNVVACIPLTQPSDVCTMDLAATRMEDTSKGQCEKINNGHRSGWARDAAHPSFADGLSRRCAADRNTGCTTDTLHGICPEGVDHVMVTVPNHPTAISASREDSPEDNGAVEKRKLAQQYLHLRGAGWKKDWDGKWIRDEDAEFDSDEEPPDLP